jgi:hypothetical protein
VRGTLTSRTGFVYIIAYRSALAQETARPASPEAALTVKDICNDTSGDRTTRVFIVNKTDWTIKIGFVQLLDQSGNIPPGYISDTGVIVLGVNNTGPATVATDPCYAGGDKRPIQATHAKGSVKLTKGSQEQDFNFPDQDTHDVTSYFGTVGWDITPEMLKEPSTLKKH